MERKSKEKKFEAWAVIEEKNFWSEDEYKIPVAACRFTPKDETESLAPCAIFVYRGDAVLCRKLAIKKGASKTLSIRKVLVFV